MYINTCKRVNTRLFSGSEGNFQNVLPGSVVNSGITDKDIYEFYLVSVATRQGMVAPTKYTIIFDEIKADSWMIESLTYKLCFGYFNVSGAIKEPSVIRYAHRLALLVGERADQKNEAPTVHPYNEKKAPSLYFI